MSTTAQMPKVSECSVAGCSYNHDGCNAFAVTIDGSSDCATFIDLGTIGGLSRPVAQVGACQRAECTHNAELECTAASVRVGAEGGTANCLTFATR